MPLFSIIVPVHNGENTLIRCLDSLKEQIETDFEVLIAENGSCDRSVSICKDYVQKDSRFHLFTLGNCDGPSTGRNCGLDHAKGDYIAFVDCDDYVTLDYLHKLRQTFEQAPADVVFMGYRQVTEQGDELCCKIPQTVEGSDFYTTVTTLNDQDLFGYTWIKAFRRDVIGNHRFREDLNLLEDEVFTCQVLMQQPCIALLTEAVYYYVTGNTGSLMGRTHPDFCTKCSAAFEAWSALLAGWPQADAYLTQMANRFVERCRYYGFERDVAVGDFFAQLADTQYFAKCNLSGSFYTAVRQHRFASLRMQKQMYVAKNKVYSMLHER